MLESKTFLKRFDYFQIDVEHLHFFLYLFVYPFIHLFDLFIYFYSLSFIYLFFIYDSSVEFFCSFIYIRSLASFDSSSLSTKDQGREQRKLSIHRAWRSCQSKGREQRLTFNHTEPVCERSVVGLELFVIRLDPVVFFLQGVLVSFQQVETGGHLV